MKDRLDISNRLLDDILKEAKKKNVISIERYLLLKGYNKMIARDIQVKLIRDGYATIVNDGEYSIRISTDGHLLLKDGGYVRQKIKEYIPPATALIGCITGVISLVWNVLAWILE